METIRSVVECIGWITLLLPCLAILMFVVVVLTDYAIQHSQHYWTSIEYAVLRKKYGKSEVWAEIIKRYTGDK